MASHHISNGRLGGLATFRKYGAAHMSVIGSYGADVFHSRYQLVPLGQNDFAIVNRATGERVNTLSGRPLSRREVM